MRLPHVLAWRLTAFLILSLLGLRGPAAAELWRSPSQEMVYVQIEKRLRNPLLDADLTASLPPSEVFEPLPKDVEALLGPLAVEYDAFVATYVPAGLAQGLLDRIREYGFLHQLDTDRRVSLSWHSFDPGNPETRTPLELARRLTPRPVAGWFLVQFAYPVREDWLESLHDCGVDRLATFQQSTFLVRASSLSVILSCGISRYLSWIDSFLTTDRTSLQFLEEDYPEGYWLQFAPGTDLRQKASNLPPSFVLEETYGVREEGAAFLRVEASAQDLAGFIDRDPDLLSVTHHGEIYPSDERQGQVVAGNHNGTAVTTPGYRAWLNSRSLLTASNQQIVGIIDLGYDDGSPPSPGVVDHHPDLESPERLVGLEPFPTSAHTSDAIGHGTMVAGIIAGEGATGTGLKDAQGFYYGSGIAPGVQLAVAALGGTQLASETDNNVDKALAFCRNNSDGTDRSFVGNNSWNLLKQDAGGNFVPLNEYTPRAQSIDSRVVDANIFLSGLQPMTLVFSAGNYAYDYATGLTRLDSVSSPATAKNVITVGATENYRPVSQTGEPPLDCVPLSNNARPPNEDATHIARIAPFSGRGRAFAPYPSPVLANVTRIKPDLVAPAVRVFSTVPYDFDEYRNAPGVVGCTKFFPSGTYYTYGTGTSFAAPVVTGVAALKRKWFLDRGTTPSPTLIKAALIATADSLGGVLGNDHRPSPHSGWGRVNLNRATDSRARFYVTDNQGLAVGTGQARSWSRTIGDPASATYIVLAWSDPPSVTGGSQVPLVNDLMLTVQRTTGGVQWAGNSFNENLIGIDDGYSYPYSFGPVANDTINNVEAIFIPANTFTAGQQLTITVIGQNVTQGTQKFAIYAYNVQLSQ